MATIIIYAVNQDYLVNTIETLVDVTPPEHQIIICADGFSVDESKFDAQVVSSKQRRGRAATFNLVVGLVTHEQLIFIQSGTKVTSGWSEALLAAIDPTTITIPKIYQLDDKLWSLYGQASSRWGWRWDLIPYRQPQVGVESITASPVCYALTTERLKELGGFDDGMKSGDGEILELSLRNWLYGGKTVISNSIVGSSYAPDYSIVNRARIAEVWFDKHLPQFHRAVKLQNQLNLGKLNSQLAIKQRQQRGFDWFVDAYLPELSGVFQLHGCLHGKSVAIVSDGPSIDLINPNLINRHDSIIAIDHVYRFFQCDYVFSFNPVVLRDALLESTAKILAPAILQSSTGSTLCMASKISNEIIPYELLYEGVLPTAIVPPFANFRHPVHAAIQFALFAGAAEVIVYGSDNKLVGDKSHTARIDYYNDGKYYGDNQYTWEQFNFYESGLVALGKLAASLGVVLLRLNHA